MLAGKVGVALGVASKRSIAAAVAQTWQKHGAKVVLGIQSERFRSAAESLGAAWATPPKVVVCDASSDASIAAAFEEVADATGGRLDAMLHSIAYAPAAAMKGRLLDVTRDDFHVAMDVSVYSLVAMCRAAQPLFVEAGGGAVTTLSYIGAQRAVSEYSVMGPSKAALESCVQYLASDLGADNVRVNAISAGPVNTLAARGIRNFTHMRQDAASKAALPTEVTATQVADMAAFLASDGAATVTGQTLYVDGGYSAML